MSSAEERLAEPAQLIRRHADTAVTDLDEDVLIAGHHHVDRFAGIAVGECVEYQVFDRGSQKVRIGACPEGCGGKSQYHSAVSVHPGYTGPHEFPGVDVIP